MAKPVLSVIVPARGADNHLALDLVEMDRLLDAEDVPAELIVVFDGAGERTREMVGRFAEVIKYLKAVENVGAPGIGVAARLGILAAAGTWRLVARDPVILSAALAALSSFPKTSASGRGNRAFEAVIGIAQAPQGLAARMHPARLAGYVCDRVSRSVLGLRAATARPLFLALSENAASRIVSRGKINSESFVAELILLAETDGLKIGRVIVEGVAAGGGFRGNLQTIAGAVRMRWWLARGKYVA